MGASEQKDIEAVEQLVTIGYMDAVHSNDPSIYASLFSEDGMWMPPESQPVVGRIAIEDAERHIFSAVSLQIESRMLEAGVSGDMGWALGEIDGTKIPHDGSASSEFHFRLMWIVYRVYVSWKILTQTALECPTFWNRR